jgi:hypothetical protein
MRVFSLETDRARDFFSYNLVLFALIVIVAFFEDSVSSQHRLWFLVGLFVGIPGGVLYVRFYLLRHIKGNTLYLYSSIKSLFFMVLVGLVAGFLLASMSFPREYIELFIVFMVGSVITNMMVFIFHIVRFERAHGPLYMKKGKPEKEA